MVFKFAKRFILGVAVKNFEIIFCELMRFLTGFQIFALKIR